MKRRYSPLSGVGTNALVVVRSHRGGARWVYKKCTAIVRGLDDTLASKSAKDTLAVKVCRETLGLHTVYCTEAVLDGS